MQPLIYTAHSVASERHPERNEDSFIADQESGLAGVFDGVGVPAKAKISASQIAARVLLQEWKQFILQKQPEHTLLTLGSQDTSIDQATHPDQLSETELSYFKKRYEIFQMLGASHITIHSDQTRIIPGDHILLCSDGIHDNLTNDEIEESIKQIDPTTIAQVLVERALERSRQESDVTLRAKPDDMTAVVITYQR
jgi:serine/threonine protein phosphatase PrpC